MVGFECDGLSSQLEVPLSSQPALWDPACMNMCSKSLGKVQTTSEVSDPRAECCLAVFYSTCKKKHVGSEFVCAEAAAPRRAGTPRDAQEELRPSPLPAPAGLPSSVSVKRSLSQPQITFPAFSAYHHLFVWRSCVSRCPAP